MAFRLRQITTTTSSIAEDSPDSGEPTAENVESVEIRGTRNQYDRHHRLI